MVCLRQVVDVGCATYPFVMIKLPRVIARLSFITGLALCLSGGVMAADSLTQKLQDFDAKLASLASTTSDPRQQTSQMAAQRFGEQLKALVHLVDRGEYERAINQLNALSGVGLPPELAKTWSALSLATIKELETAQAEMTSKWVAEVDACARAAQEACLNAKSSGDLDSLLVKVAALQLRRPGNANDVVSQRAVRRLGSLASTLEAWMNYLDFTTAGNVKAANNALRSLSTNDSLVPVLRVADITARIVEEQVNTEAFVGQVYSSIRSPDDIAPALAKLSSQGKVLNGDTQLYNERRFLEVLQQGKEACDKDDAALAIKAVSTSRSLGGTAGFALYREKLIAMIERLSLLRVITKKSGMEPTTDESAADYAQRVMDALYKNGDYEKLIAVMAAQDELLAGKKSFTETRHTLERFLAARRFEAVNDHAFAIAEYRRVLRANAGDYSPVQLAGEALKRLQAAHPELFTTTESRVLAEVEALRQDVQAMGRYQSMHGAPLRR
jgi:hypothetical protein